MQLNHPIVVRPAQAISAKPLERLTVVLASESTSLEVLDGAGRVYARPPICDGVAEFIVAGALGKQIVRIFNCSGHEIGRCEIVVDATTSISDAGGRFSELLALCDKTMRCYSPTGVVHRTYRGKTYPCFVHWILDHAHTAKGMQYFSDATAGLVDLLALVQREDGMIWSFVDQDKGPGFFDTRDRNRGIFTRRVDGLLLVRQPIENHCEYNYVDAMHLAWKGSGDDDWMAGKLDSAIRALNYTMNDRTRWSSRFQLLKRGYTIDSWDFQVVDEYTPNLGLGTDMLIDADKTKFGVFFGDNHGYAMACDQLSEMLAHTGRTDEAKQFAQRGSDIRDRLTTLTWNGHFFRHRVEEDDSVKRNLGVDEAGQIAMSNCYATNRHITGEQAMAIFETYKTLRKTAPAGSPGEWYAIYPPFGRGFGHHNARWQYMNGGVHGHAGGELARGAFEHGDESYGADILQRLADLAVKHNGVKFAYTGAYEPDPPPQKFTTINLTSIANMNLTVKAGREAAENWMHASDAGNDMAGLPTGRQTFADVPFEIAPGELSVVSVAHAPGFAESVSIPLNTIRAEAIYLLHCAAGLTHSQNAAAMTIVYADGTERAVYIQGGKHLAGWWFPTLNQKDAGVAWRGPNAVCTDVGIYWAALPNPRPDQPILGLRFNASIDGSIYALFGVTLADRMPYHRPSDVSYGGPDPWAGGTVTCALVEGLAGVADSDNSTAYRGAVVAPRWLSAGVSEATVTVRRPASDGYVAYQYHHDAAAKTIRLLFTSAGAARLRILLPSTAADVAHTLVNHQTIEAQVEHVGLSKYVVFECDQPAGLIDVTLTYK